MRVKSFSKENGKMPSLDVINTDDEPLILLKIEDDILFPNYLRDIVVRDATEEDYQTYFKRCKIIYESPSGKQTHIPDGRIRYETDAKYRYSEMTADRLECDLEKEKQNNIKLADEIEALKKELEVTKGNLQEQVEYNKHHISKYEKLHKIYENSKEELQKEKEERKIIVQQHEDQYLTLKKEFNKLETAFDKAVSDLNILEEENNSIKQKNAFINSHRESNKKEIEDLKNDIEYLLDCYYNDVERLKNRLETKENCLKATAYELNELKENITDVLSDFYEVWKKYYGFYRNQQGKNKDTRQSIVADYLSKGLKSKDIHKILIEKGFDITEKTVKNDMKEIQSQSI